MSYRVLEGFEPALPREPALRNRLLAARATAALALRTVASRRDLVELDERSLADVGLTHEMALAEARRAPWDLEPFTPRRRGNGGRGGSGPWATAWRRSLGRLQDGMREMLLRRRTRQAIAELDGRMLKDIGVSYSEAEHEANKAFWHR
ncbi:MAG: hypothetical protein BGO51_21610 [Rhodospirillales bacterium 69-11]|nr:MAG: hypothetical protein BGO51_21610 [Rhodospirillales bacterium 69-11]